MSSPLRSLIECGTKLWLDSIDPELVKTNRELGATGATSNPVIVSDLIETGGSDDRIEKFIGDGVEDAAIAWAVTDELVRQAQDVFLPVWESTKGNDGYVSFEVDPLLEDPGANMPHAERVSQYIALGKKWAEGHRNRMIKVPATAAGLDALEELATAGITLNVTLIFTQSQYEAARDAIWRGAQRRSSLDDFKSVYSIFISRVDVYTAEHVSELSDDAQGLVGIVNAKRMWSANQDFWRDKGCRLDQEIVFASTGTKNAGDPPWKYVEALAGSDIQTNPPSTNDAVAASGMTFTKRVDQMPPQSVLDEIDAKIDVAKMHEVLMREGIEKFAKPQQSLLDLISRKWAELS